MLYDPKWEQQTKAKRETREPSLAGFIAWLEKQPQDKEYNWGDSKHCACAQYFKGDWTLHDVVTHRDGVRLDGLALERPWTFGALLSRARAAAR